MFATYLLLLFHVGMVFNPAPFYHVRNTDVSFVFLILCGFISLWHMPLFFLLAGWSAFSSLSLRGTGGFLRERFFRLFVPLVAGCVLLMPAIKYLELSSGLDANYTGLYVAPKLQDGFRQVIPSGLPVAAPFDESFCEFLPTFFTHPIALHLGAPLVRRLPAHVHASLPAAVRAYSRCAPMVRGWRFAHLGLCPDRTARDRTGDDAPALAGLAEPLRRLGELCLLQHLPASLGSCWRAFPRSKTAAHLERKRALVIALGATVVLLLGVFGVFSSPAVILARTAIAGWCFVVAFLGWSRQHLSFSTPALRYLTESAFPVYLLHQSAIVIPGYFLIQLPLGVWTKFVLLLVVSSSLTLCAYHMLVRPFSLTRFLCGMKGRERPASRQLAAGASAAILVVAAWAMFTTAAASGASHAASVNPVGRWYAEGGAAKVEITQCEEGLCGRVAWLRSPLDEDGCELHDRNNPDPNLRARSVLGLEILRAASVPASGDAAESCTVYDPVSGRTYHCQLWLDGDDRLRLRGYVGVPLFGRTATWLRVGSEARTCLERSASGEGSVE